MRLDHIEAYLALSAKTKIYFATAVETWDADFYVKVDDDVHVNIVCEWKNLIGHTCVATLDWACSGICNSQERIRDVHKRCSEDENDLWQVIV
ncbi:Glycosyl transferase, family 31 [Cynara cardunculus var. scolymus]|uniref:Glycosyl transferase, family 31 n=1 Tax=Cynara cardunculus var. scolymus TaxID=59895 RepID=A0A118K0D7_CYNCS|nr:Glycosyl transferase, family 31 [Cynara cardunculus var. scolymus]